MTYTFNETQMAELNRLVAHYPEGKQKSALLPALHLAQDSFDGWLPTELMDYVASLLHIEPIEVYEVASFYSMFNLKPVGKFIFEVCQTGPCMISGSDDIIAYIQQQLASIAVTPILLSAKNKLGVDELKNQLLSLVNTGALRNNETIVTNTRHYDALLKALDEIQKVWARNIGGWLRRGWIKELTLESTNSGFFLIPMC